MRRFLNVSNHELSEAQKQDLIDNYGVDYISNLPADLKALWGQIDPEASTLDLRVSVVDKIVAYAKTEEINMAMVMGEFTVVHHVVKRLSKDVVFLVATSKRVVKELEQPDGSIRKVSVFNHVQFREL